MEGQGAAPKPAAHGLSSELSNLLQNSTSERRLDFNAPLLSVRRHAAFPSVRLANFLNQADQMWYEPDMKENAKKSSGVPTLDSLRSPGEVPFLWEQSPGRPKESGNDAASAVHSFTPRLPPCRAGSPVLIRVPVGRRTSPMQNVYNDDPLPINQRSCRPAANMVIPMCPEKVAPRYLPSSLGHSLEIKSSESRASNSSNDDAFSDAAETFAQTVARTNTVRDSSFGGRDSAVSLANYTDPHSRDLIMRRSWPAAQAITSHDSPASNRNVVKKYQPLLCVKSPYRSDASRSMFPQHVMSAQNDSDSDSDDAENSVFSSKACNSFAFRFGAAIRNLLPQTNSSKAKRRGNPYSVEFTKTKSNIDDSKVQNQPCGVVFNDEEFLEGINSIEENYFDLKKKHSSHSRSDRPSPSRAIIEPESISNQDQPSFQAANGIQGADQNNFYIQSTRHEAKGFLRFFRDKIPELPVKEQCFKVESAERTREQKFRTQTEVSLIGSLEGELKQVTLLQTHKGVAQGGAGNVTSETMLNFTEPEDLPGQYIAVEGGGSLTNCIESQSASYRRIPMDTLNNVSLAVKEQSAETTGKQGWPLALTSYNTCLSNITEMDNKLSPGQKLPARPKATTNGRNKKVYWQEQLIKSNPITPSLPPLPKAPSQPWQWRSPSPACSSPLVAYTSPGNVYEYKTDVNGLASWESLVKSAHVQTGHLRYSNELVNKPSAGDSVDAKGVDGL